MARGGFVHAHLICSSLTQPGALAASAVRVGAATPAFVCALLEGWARLDPRPADVCVVVLLVFAPRCFESPGALETQGMAHGVWHVLYFTHVVKPSAPCPWPVLTLPRFASSAFVWLECG